MSYSPLFQMQVGTPRGFSRPDSKTPLSRKPRWVDDPRKFPHGSDQVFPLLFLRVAIYVPPY